MMMGPNLKSFLAAIAAAGLAVNVAVAQDDAPPAPEDDTGVEIPDYPPDRLPQTTKQCEFFRTIYDWRPLDAYNLIVYFNNRHTPRHLELETPCYGLRFTDTIAFTDGVGRGAGRVGDGRLCSFGGDSIIVDGQFCEIGAIHKLTVEEADELRQAFRDRSKNRRKKKDEDVANDND